MSYELHSFIVRHQSAFPRGSNFLGNTVTSECQQHDRAADNGPCSQTLFFQYNFTLKSSQGIKQNILSS